MDKNGHQQESDFIELDDFQHFSGAKKIPRILIVDDDAIVRKVITDAMELLSCDVTEAENGEQALEMAMDQYFDLILLDIMMPGKSGIECLQELRSKGSEVEVIMVTASQDLEVAIEAMRHGANDYIRKPFTPRELQVSVEKAFQRADLKFFTRDYTLSLERKIEAKDDQIRLLFYEAIQAMINTIEAKDFYTKGHSHRVTMYAMWLAKELKLNFKEAKDVHLAAQLHDIGKLSVPDAILNKPGNLTEEEFSLIKLHPERGCKILAPILSSQNLNCVMHHHEKWEGSGYPSGLSGNDIPLKARIITIADSFDAMTSRRSYRAPMKISDACEEVETCSGTHFDPELVGTFTASVKENLRQS